ncbi:MAG: hypothetical protein ACPHFV_03115 [Poseidonia sp.]
MKNKTLIEHFFVQERTERKKFMVAIWSIVILTDVFILIAYLQGMGAYRIVQFLTIPLALALTVNWLSIHRVKTLQGRLSALLDSIEFGWEELNGLDLNEKEADHLHQAFASTTIGRIATNETYLRTRGTDEKGPAFDKAEGRVDPTLLRVDPSLHEADYEGLEGDLEVSEKLVEEANQYYAAVAQRQWEAAEKNDVDLVEAGVERLGDLVASGWFEQNAKDGAVRELMESGDDAP